MPDPNSMTTEPGYFSLEVVSKGKRFDNNLDNKTRRTGK